MFSTISARRIVRPLPPFASPLNLMHTDAHRSAKCRDCRVARNLSPVSHWCVCDLSNSCPFCTLLLELCVPDPESKRNIKEMCNAFSDGRSVFCLRVHTSKCCKMDWPQIDANWDKRQPSEAWLYRVNSQGCSEDVAEKCTNETWKAGQESRESSHCACQRSEITYFVFSYFGPRFLAKRRSWNFHQIQGTRQF